MKRLSRKNRVVSSRRIRSRRITASMNQTDRDFMRFLRELETDLQNNESEYITLRAGGSVTDADGGSLYEIIPQINGQRGDDFLDVLMIDVDPSGIITAYCKGNDDVVAEGYSFNQISFNCYNWLKETLIQMYEELDGYSIDSEYDY